MHKMDMHAVTSAKLNAHLVQYFPVKIYANILRQCAYA